MCRACVLSGALGPVASPLRSARSACHWPSTSAATGAALL